MEEKIQIYKNEIEREVKKEDEKIEENKRNDF